MLRAFDHVCMEKARYRFLIIIIIIPMITRVLFSLRLFSTTWAEPDKIWQPSYYLAEEWWEVL